MRVSPYLRSEIVRSPRNIGTLLSAVVALVIEQVMRRNAALGTNSSAVSVWLQRRRSILPSLSEMSFVSHEPGKQ